MKIAWPSHRLSRWRRQLVKVTSFVLASFFLALALALPGNSIVPSASNGATIGNVESAPELLAQRPVTIVEFRTPNYAVRVFNDAGNEGGVTRMNVFHRTPPQELEQNAQPAVLNANVIKEGFVTYDSFGSRYDRNVVFRVNASASPQQAELEIRDQNTGAVILTEFATEILQMNLPSVPGGGTNENTILFFETPVHSVRIFRDANDRNIRKMNVFNRLTGQTQVNGKIADLINPPMAPYENWVSYYAGESFSGVAGRWVARVNGRGEALLQFLDSNLNTLISENRLSNYPIIVNIPGEDIPPGVDPPASSASLAPWIAAVFGDQTTLEQLEVLYSSAPALPSCGESARQQPFFESARQGRFINAGSFDNRNCAEALVSYLRSQGYNARLVYRDFRYR
jgi:hypothetical protein